MSHFKRVLTIVSLTLLAAVWGCGKKAQDMVFVPEGEFIMGSDKGAPDEGPQRKVNLKAFYMDKFEVTNEKYKRFVDEKKYREPRDWAVYGYQEERKDHPVVFVSREDAKSFCKWAGKRLPAEEEWEKAARGTDGRIYPWGMEFDRTMANTSTSGMVGTAEVTTYDGGKSPYGAYNMAGNVWEWTDSDYDGKTKVARGGSWGLTHRFAQTFFRVGYPPKTAINNLGFRCAKDG